ncbi:hypothetical protein ACTA71_008658 [Dictyostelium dimigraforme]
MLDNFINNTYQCGRIISSFKCTAKYYKRNQKQLFGSYQQSKDHHNQHNQTIISSCGVRFIGVWSKNKDSEIFEEEMPGVNSNNGNLNAKAINSRVAQMLKV